MNGLAVVGNLVKELPKGILGKSICGSEKALPGATSHWSDEVLSGLVKVYDKSAVEKALEKQGFKSIEEAFDALAKDPQADVPRFVRKAFNRSRISFSEDYHGISMGGNEKAKFHYGFDDEANDLFPWGVITPFEQGEKGSCWLLSAIHSLSGKTDFRDMVKVDGFKGSASFEIKFPGSNNFITVTEKEIAENGVKGSAGVKLLETAAEKYYKPVMARGLESNWGEESLRLLTGEMPATFGNTCFDSIKELESESGIKQLMDTLWDAEKKAKSCAVVGTVMNPKNAKNLTAQHAYSVFPVDGGQLRIVDPHSSAQTRAHLTFDEFLDVFSEVSIARKKAGEQISAVA